MTDFLFGLALGGKPFEIEMPHVWFLKGTLFEITNVVMTEWAIVAALIIIALFINRAVINGRFTKLRGTMELLVDFLEGWYASFIGGRKNARRFMPLLGSFFLFILFCNYTGLFPTAGSPGSVFAPTGRWGTTVGLAIVVAVVCQYVAIVELGLWGWVKHLLHLGPLSVLEEFVRPFSLSLRLFGNIFGEETLLAVIIFLLPGIAPVPIMGLSLMFGAIQAVVFTTLTAIYIGGVLEHAEHVKAHAQGHDAHKPEAAHAH
ncbi:MAG TPA: FoF1 ATP synthase subunit a [Symbiobacteriaceae bacterium]